MRFIQLCDRDYPWNVGPLPWAKRPTVWLLIALSWKLSFHLHPRSQRHNQALPRCEQVLPVVARAEASGS